MDYLFISGQVQAQESKLLNVNRLDRMIGAATPEEAFRVLSELQYSECLDENTKAESFDEVISQGLIETKGMLDRGVEASSGLLFIWLRFDINNLKRALKIKLLENKDSISAFTQENGFSSLGVLNEEAIESIVFKGQDVEGIDEKILKVVSQATDILEKHDGAFRFVEYALDQAYFQVLSALVKRSRNTFLKDLFTYTVESTNFRNIARSVLISEEAIIEEAWLAFGDFTYSEVSEIKTFEAFAAWAERTKFEAVMDGMVEGEKTNLIIIEKYLDSCYQSFLNKSVLGEIASIQIPFVYFEKRLQNARLLKFVMFAKFHGLSADAIYKTLEKF